jgi:hypothetical protein
LEPDDIPDLWEAGSVPAIPAPIPRGLERGIIFVRETDWHWDHGHQCEHPKGEIMCEYGYLTGETAESLWEKEQEAKPSS